SLLSAGCLAERWDLARRPLMSYGGKSRVARGRREIVATAFRFTCYVSGRGARLGSAQVFGKKRAHQKKAPYHRGNLSQTRSHCAGGGWNDRSSGWGCAPVAQA